MSVTFEDFFLANGSPWGPVGPITTLQQEITDDAPIAFYHLNEPPGSLILQDGMGGYSLTPQGTSLVVGAESPLGSEPYAVQFTNVATTTTNLVGPTNPGSKYSPEVVANGGLMSVECILTPDFTNNAGYIVTKAGLGSQYEWGLQYTATGKVGCVVWSSAGATYAGGSSPVGMLTQGKTSHILWTYNAGTSRMYVDGVLVYSDAGPTGSTPPSVTTAPIMIGNRSDAGFAWSMTGKVQEVAIYNKILTLADAVRHYQAAGLAPTDTTFAAFGIPL